MALIRDQTCIPCIGGRILVPPEKSMKGFLTVRKLSHHHMHYSRLLGNSSGADGSGDLNSSPAQPVTIWITFTTWASHLTSLGLTV